MPRILIPILCATIILGGCSNDLNPVIPDFSGISWLQNVRRLTLEQQRRMDGIFASLSPSGTLEFGDSVVVKWANGYPSIYCGRNAAYFVLDGGIVGDSIVIEGYWRYAYSPQTGRARFTVGQYEGAQAVINGGEPPARLILRGSFDGSAGALEGHFDIEWKRSIAAAAEPYYVLGHRGGGRNSDLHPYSENSVEMIRFSERLGCNGVEIDVQLTDDGVAILYHDVTLNTRLVRGDYLVGPITAYSWSQLQRFATLINGEKIPTLEEALNTAIDETTLRFVWLDIKDPNVVKAITPIVLNALHRAEQKKRNIKIVMGLPTPDVYNAYMALPVNDRLPALCELSYAETRAAGAAVWAPRWTLGLQHSLVAQAHAEGRIVLVWTLDVDEFIRQYMIQGNFDGILTNYPTLVAYYNYMRT